MLIKHYLLLFLFQTTITISFAQYEPENITSRFFEIYKTGNSDKALDYIFSTNKYAKESEKSINELKRNLSNAINAYGFFISFELLSKKTAGNSLVMYTFLVKHDRTPLTFRILLYKPKDHWQLQNITFDNKIDEELDEASKLYKPHP